MLLNEKLTLSRSDKDISAQHMLWKTRLEINAAEGAELHQLSNTTIFIFHSDTLLVDLTKRLGNCCTLKLFGCNVGCGLKAAPTNYNADVTLSPDYF